MDQATVLIITDEAEFSSAVTARWQAERQVPVFILMSGDLCHELDPGAFDLAIVGEVRKGSHSEILPALDNCRKPVLFVCKGGTTETQWPQSRVKVLRKDDGWLNALVLVAMESLRSAQATDRAHRAEQANAVLERQALLGRYMLDMRHTLNNALTSVLGNSELLLLEPGTLAAPALAQVETIRNMAMRINEILQRFSSLEKELKMVERQAENENQPKTQAAAAAS